jgi:histidinol-phosphate aminotransferase
MRNLMRPELGNLKAYSMGVREEQGIWLNLNESPWDRDEHSVIEKINRYPEGVPSALMIRLAEIYKVSPDQVLLTRGSDEGIDILVRVFCCPYKDAVIICPPTFGMYQQSAWLQGAKVIEVPLLESEDYAFNMDSIAANITKQTKIIFLCSPNNPTGNLIPVSEISKLVERVKDNTIVVVDEAYIEFSQNESMASSINKFNNLVVLRTLSKAFGLAGLRCGVLISQAPLIKILQDIMPPYLFPMIILQTLLNALNKESLVQIENNINFIKKQRESLKQALIKINSIHKVFNSEANFLFLDCENVEKIIKHCASSHIYVRNFKTLALANKLRVSIGLESDNQRLISVLREIA